MGIVYAEISMSLDGMVAGPNMSEDHRLGENGDLLHDWTPHDMDEADRPIAAEFFATAGAFIIGRATFDLGIDVWGDDGTFGMPCFVVTHRPQPALVKGPTTFTFVTDGPESALEQARAAAGDRDVCVMGGGTLIRQYWEAGLIDELRLHLIPLLLGKGTRLFERTDAPPVHLNVTRTVQSPRATHLTYRVVR